MLHLRACYDSKAAIFKAGFATLRRSKIEVPPEFQGLESLGAAPVATVFILASLTAERA
jgi:hypothetical protein